MAKLADLMDNGSRERERGSGSETTRPREENPMQTFRSFARDIQRVVSPYDGRFAQSHLMQTLSEVMGLTGPCKGFARQLLFELEPQEILAHSFEFLEGDAAPHMRKITRVERDDLCLQPAFIPHSDLNERLRRLETHIDSASAAGRIDESADDWEPYMPSSWFEDEFQMDPEKLRAAYRTGYVRRRKFKGRVYYSVPDAQELWPDEVLWWPKLPARSGSQRPDAADRG